MRITDDIANKIDQYLNGELIGKELQAFEDQIASNPDLATEVELQRTVNDAIFDNGLLDYKEKIAGDLKKINQRKSGLRLGLIVLIAIGTGVLTYTLWPKDTLEPYQKEEEIVFNNMNPDSIVKIPTHSSEPTPLRGNMKLSGVEENNTEPQDPAQDTNTVNSTNNNTITTSPTSDNEDHSNETVIEDLCKKVKITSKIKHSEPCVGEITGTINFTNIQGGTSPYRCTIEKEKNHTNKTTFNNLGTGDYYLSIIDANECETVVDSNFQILGKHCLKPFRYEENTFIPAKGFSPDFENWIFKDSEGRNITLEIYDKRYQKIREFKNQKIIEWDGTNNSNQRVETGLYVYIVKIEGIPAQKGTVTVMN